MADDPKPVEPAAVEPKPADAGTPGQPSQPTAAEATPSVAEPAVVASPAAPGIQPTASATPAEPTLAKPQRDWREDRIAKLTAQLRETQEKLAATVQTASAPDATREAEINALANQRAQELAVTAKFNSDCDAAAQVGRKEFPDFEAKIGELRRLVTPGDPTSSAAQVALVQAALQTGEAHRVLHRLGGDLNEAARIMALPPMAMAVEVAKVALRDPVIVDPPLPKPITPVWARGAPHTEISPDDPERGGRLSTAEWMARRNAQVEERWKARGR
jgi:hypothetical protein